jgi:hypothetical protein
LCSPSILQTKMPLLKPVTTPSFVSCCYLLNKGL